MNIHIDWQQWLDSYKSKLKYQQDRFRCPPIAEKPEFLAIQILPARRPKLDFPDIFSLFKNTLLTELTIQAQWIGLAPGVLPHSLRLSIHPRLKEQFPRKQKQHLMMVKQFPQNNKVTLNRPWPCSPSPSVRRPRPSHPKNSLYAFSSLKPQSNLRIIIIVQMYFPFLQNDFNPYYYYCSYPYESALQSPQKSEDSLESQPTPTNTLKIEEKDAEDIEQYILENISITVKDLREAGYEKKKQPWTEDEDGKLMALIGRKLKWTQIADQMEGRSIKMCYSRYKRLEKKGEDRRGFWSNEEDKRLIQLVENYGQNWKELSIYFQNRKPKQLRERYINALTPNISKEPWTLEEDLKLIELYNMFGKKWKSIAEELNCRSENQVKNRFYGRILPLEMRKSKATR